MKKYLLNFPITIGGYSTFLTNIVAMASEQKPAAICVANVHMFVEAHTDERFRSVIEQADMVTPDGKPLTWALKMLYGVSQDRVAGMDLLPDLLKKMEEQNLTAYFYGGSQSILDETKKFLENKYPALYVAGLYSPPFRALSIEEENQVADRINKAAPNIVFVILGCPKQERWMHAMKDRINSVMIGVGGALPVMIGIQKRAPLWMQKAGLEWFYRLAQEPGRLFKRYAVTNSIFIWLIGKEWFKLKWLVPSKWNKSL